MHLEMLDIVITSKMTNEISEKKISLYLEEIQNLFSSEQIFIQKKAFLYLGDEYNEKTNKLYD